MPQRRHTFPCSRRLGGKDAFRRVFDEGSRTGRGPLTAFVRPNGLAHARLGLTVSRRVGNAARRNRIKRLLREAFRHLQHDVPTGIDIVLVVRPHEPLPLAEYQRILTALMVRAHGQGRGPRREDKPPTPSTE
jgi:ribonuclease P protein component